MILKQVFGKIKSFLVWEWNISLINIDTKIQVTIVLKFKRKESFHGNILGDRFTTVLSFLNYHYM